MAILIDTPRSTNFRHFQQTAHCASNLIGPEGTAELLEFGRSLGLLKRWLQYPGSPKEHFDLFDKKIVLALKKGAKPVSNSSFISQCVWPKRQALSIKKDN